MASPRTLIIIPTYNERENISKMVNSILGLQQGYHLLFIDDNSPDGSADLIETLMEKHPEVFLEKRPGKLGLGTAYIHGFKWALNRDYAFIIEMDCDFSHNPNDLPRLVAACEAGVDCAIGSRYVRGGKVRNWPAKRILMSYFASVYVRLILLINIKDTTAGFKCYRNIVLSTIPLDIIPFKGYAFQICMKYAAIKLGFKVKEIPITFVDRIAGDSKMSTGIFKEAFFGVWQMRKMKWK
ncbi:MAG: polyprenol monophosphomannose synthase [Sphingomonadales bacterium]